MVLNQGRRGRVVTDARHEDGDLGSAEREVEQLLSGLRQELVHGSTRLFRQHLAPDAVILPLDDPGIYQGKDDCLEYIRRIQQQTNLKSLNATIENLKICGDTAVVLERGHTQYEVRGQRFSDIARTTWALFRSNGRWLVTHIHLESLAPNRIVGGGPNQS